VQFLPNQLDAPSNKGAAYTEPCSLLAIGFVNRIHVRTRRSSAPCARTAASGGIVERQGHGRNHVADGSKATVAPSARDVGFTPNTGNAWRPPALPRWAMSRSPNAPELCVQEMQKFFLLS
jgi:hypothetical protein